MTSPNNRLLNDLEQDLLAAISKAYGLSDGGHAVPNRNAWGGDRIQLIIATGDDRYLLKQWPDYVESDEEIRFSLAVQDLARQNGIPVPPVLATRDGQRVFVWRGLRFSLQRFVGQAYDPDQPEQFSSFIKMLGQYHQAVTDHHLTGQQWDIVPLSRHHLNGIETDVSKLPLTAEDQQYLRDLVAELREMLAITERRMKRLGWSKLPLIPVHGDYHIFNCRFAGNEVVGVVDFDNTRLEPRLYDLAYALNTMLGLDWRREYDHVFLWAGVKPLQPMAVQTWLSAYLLKAPPWYCPYIS